MLILGLTGSIGMGKSTAAAHLRARGIPVFDADAHVHALYAKGGAAVSPIEAAFPGTTANGAVDRTRLAAALASSPDGFTRLEAIVHPLVRDAEQTFLNLHHKNGVRIAVLEIPLLFETKADALVDATIVLSTDPATQRARVLARPGMTEAKLDMILARQLPDAEKRRRADFVVDTSGPVTDTHAQIDSVLGKLQAHKAAAFEKHWRPSDRT
jgi:dephospho-CoA kinase